MGAVQVEVRMESPGAVCPGCGADPPWGGEWGERGTMEEEAVVRCGIGVVLGDADRCAWMCGGGGGEMHREGMCVRCE